MLYRYYQFKTAALQLRRKIHQMQRKSILKSELTASLYSNCLQCHSLVCNKRIESCAPSPPLLVQAHLHIPTPEHMPNATVRKPRNYKSKILQLKVTWTELLIIYILKLNNILSVRYLLYLGNHHPITWHNTVFAWMFWNLRW